GDAQSRAGEHALDAPRRGDDRGDGLHHRALPPARPAAGDNAQARVRLRDEAMSDLYAYRSGLVEIVDKPDERLWCDWKWIEEKEEDDGAGQGLTASLTGPGGP